MYLKMGREGSNKSKKGNCTHAHSQRTRNWIRDKGKKEGNKLGVENGQ